MASNVSKKSRSGSDDQSMNRICIALALLVLSVLALQFVRKRYATAAGFKTIYPALGVALIVFGVLLIVAGVLMLLSARGRLKSEKWASLARWALFPLLLGALSCGILRSSWVNHCMTLMLVHVLLYGLFIIYCLYQWEFTLFSLATGLAAIVFYRLSGEAAVLQTALKAAAFAVILLAICVVTFLASRKGGVLRIGSENVKLFGKRSTPAILYVVCGIWLICLIASLLLGPGFAYYCMFAAVALELIAAVYYTFQMK